MVVRGNVIVESSARVPYTYIISFCLFTNVTFHLFRISFTLQLYWMDKRTGEGSSTVVVSSAVCNVDIMVSDPYSSLIKT